MRIQRKPSMVRTKPTPTRPARDLNTTLRSIRFNHVRLANDHSPHGQGLGQSLANVLSHLRMDHGTWPIDDLARLRRMSFPELERQFERLSPEVRESVAMQLRRYVVHSSYG